MAIQKTEPLLTEDNLPHHPSCNEKRESEVKDRFTLLAKHWREETGDNSCFDEVVGHPDYQHIIAIGPDVIPLLLKDLQENPFDWLYALHHIAGENPASEIRGVVPAASAWIRWGKEKGYI